VTLDHKFAVVPEVMDRDTWLKNRGQPQALPRDVTPDGATKTLDLKADKPKLTPIAKAQSPSRARANSVASS
jgi:hypothetical protein